MLFAVFLSLGIGVALGLLGGGGSILTIPILVYALHVPIKSAVAMSLLVVGITSAFAALARVRSGEIRWRVAIIFGMAGMASAFLGGKVARWIPNWMLLVGFAAVMLVAAWAMLRGRFSSGDTSEDLDSAKVISSGLGVGFLTVTVGAGGGFLIVPALTLFGGLPIRIAIGTSLVVIAMQSFAGFAGYAGHVAIDMTLTMMVSAAATIGSLIGSRWCHRTSQQHLRKGFAWFVIAMALFMLGRQLPSSLGSQVETFVLAHSSWVFALAGGLLIGIAASALLLFNGRVAGVSGIASGIMTTSRGDVLWRVLFVLGLVTGGAVMFHIEPRLFSTMNRSLPWAIVAGLLVGVGTQLGNGCTSGHGICGVGRLAPRSLAATATFIATGVVTTFVIHHILGGSA